MDFFKRIGLFGFYISLPRKYQDLCYGMLFFKTKMCIEPSNAGFTKVMQFNFYLTLLNYDIVQIAITKFPRKS